MANSKRELIIQKIITNLEAAVRFSVARSPDDPVASKVDEACIVTWSRQSTSVGTAGPNVNKFILHAGMLCRSMQAERDSDAHLVAIDTAVMADLTAGGLALDIKPVGAARESIERELPIVVITNQYEVMFQTNHGDITQ